VNEAKQMEEMQRENEELKKMLTDSMLETRLLKGVNAEMVSPEHKRRMTALVIAGELCSGRMACRCLGLARSSIQYRRRPAATERTKLMQRLQELSRQYPLFGFRRIVIKLRQADYPVGRKQAQKLRQAKGLRVSPP